MQLNEWTPEQRHFVAEILENLIKSNPGNKAYEMLLDGFYSQQLYIENLVNLIQRLEQDLKLSRSLRKDVDNAVKDKITIYGDV